MVEYNFPKYSIKLEIDNDIYFPAEDTFFLLEAIVIPDNIRKIVEIGGGSGIISIVLAKNNPKIQFLITDISFSATKAICFNLEKNEIRNHVDIVCMNKLDAIHHIDSEIIIWNPPYLPEDEEDINLSPTNRLMLTGGKKGSESTYEILETIKKKNTDISFYTIFSSLSWSEEEIQKLEKEHMKLSIIDELSLFFEKLYLVKINFGEKNE